MTPMAGETALDTSVAIRYLNGDAIVVGRVIALPTIVLPLPVVLTFHVMWKILRKT
ncbi:MAG: hypothetical protein HWQ35_30010 [Nostoc sp. NMS1]|uniref:hypothetical protein n=1 Tax=Nostoc sp. NMS1 TaxID=2815388 RepID=UPI0025F83820|nr:hypothetical protein [Nostoc sp. NMS1]MBN3910621.1 hypothetical protein [Nostoc sp. NMS1]